MNSRFIKVRVRSYTILHGFDSSNQEIEETVKKEEWVDKIIALDRILSVSEKFILTSYAYQRIIYWEYEGGLAWIEKFLEKSELLVDSQKT